MNGEQQLPGKSFEVAAFGVAAAGVGLFLARRRAERVESRLREQAKLLDDVARSQAATIERALVEIGELRYELDGPAGGEADEEPTPAETDVAPPHERPVL